MARIAGVILGLTFLWAGVAKLADRRWPNAAAAFGVPELLARAISPLELVLGAVLVTVPGWVPGAISIAVLLVYTGVIARQLASGDDAPPCACFGGVSARPVSWRTLLRNAALLVLAAAVVGG